MHYICVFPDVFFSKYLNKTAVLRGEKRNLEDHLSGNIRYRKLKKYKTFYVS